MQQHLEYNRKKGLDLEWEQEHLKEGRYYTLNMVKIDRKVREVITISLGFAITEEAIEVYNFPYDRLASRYTKALARSMAQTKQIKAVSPLNNGFNGNFKSGDGSNLFATNHPTINGTFANKLATDSDLNETSLEQAMIDIADVIIS